MTVALWIGGIAIFAAGYGLGYMKGSIAELKKINHDLKELTRDC